MSIDASKVVHVWKRDIWSLTEDDWEEPEQVSFSYISSTQGILYPSEIIGYIPYRWESLS